MRSFFAALLLSTLWMTSSASAAAPAQAPSSKLSKNDRAEASRLKKEADVLMDQGRHVDALALYARAYELTTDPALLYNQGRALEALGEYPEALEKLERFDREAPQALRAKVPGLHELMSDLRGRIATLVVTTNAPGARLLVREKAAGTIEKETRVRTRAGTAMIEVVAEGYIPFKRQLELAAGTVVKVDAQLAERYTEARVFVRTTPNASISVDGDAFGRSPVELRLAPGQHTLVAEAEGRETERVPITLSAGDRRELEIELRPPPALLSRWWFWTGIGVVVAGGVATAVALTTERSPQAGSFDTGIVPGP